MLMLWLAQRAQVQFLVHFSLFISRLNFLYTLERVMRGATIIFIVILRGYGLCAHERSIAMLRTI